MRAVHVVPRIGCNRRRCCWVLWFVYWAEGRVSEHRHAQQAGRPRILQRRGALQERCGAHEHEGGRGEFLLIQSYDMFVSTLTQAVVRARTFAPGEKVSVIAVVTTPGQHPKKRIPLGFHGVSDQKEGQFLKRKEFACLYF